MPKEAKKILTPADVVHEYSLTPARLKRWRANGMLPYIRTGYRSVLYHRRDVENLLNKLTIGRR